MTNEMTSTRSLTPEQERDVEGLVKTIVDPSAGGLEGIVARIPMMHPDVLIETVLRAANAFCEKEPDEALIERLTGVLRHIPSNPQEIELLWETKREDRDKLPITLGQLTIVVWNSVAATSIDHAVMLHRHIAKHFVSVLAETKMGSKRT